MSTTEEAASTEYDGKSAGEYWKAQLEHCEKVFDKWTKRADTVIERYRDERKASELSRSKFNILWSNVQVLGPSLYGRKAKPEVSRRYMDADPAARLASMMLERCIDYEINQFPDFDSAMNSVVEDRLLGGRGTIWMRFEPNFTGAPETGQITSREVRHEIQRDADGKAVAVVDKYADGKERVRNIERDKSGNIAAVVDPGDVAPPVEAPQESIDSAHAPVDYIYWKDFRHSPARIWDEVWWVGAARYLTQEEGVDRFGDQFKNVPLSEYKEDNSKSPQDRRDETGFSQKAKVWEIWNKRTGKVCWVAEGYPMALDEREDPLHLEGFFPCPKPLYATTTNGSLVPVPDYYEYEDQARELDIVQGRITRLSKTIKAIGVYNSEFKELNRLLNEGFDNQMIPVAGWAQFSEKQGLKGAIDMLDISVQAQALAILYKTRDSIIQTIYQITGISDLMRGETSAEETLGAQQLKANFGSLRLRRSQNGVATFASDIFKLKAQIICRFYPPELIVKMSGISNTQDGQNPQLLMQAVQMLRDAEIRDFHITVESDSLAQIDDDAEKAAANEAITAIGAFMDKALPAVQAAPELLPMISQMLLFIVRKYKVGRALEASIEQSLSALQQKAAQAAANPQPSKEEIEAKIQAQSDAQRAQMDAQVSQMKAQQDMQVQVAKLKAEGQLAQQKMQMDIQAEAAKGQLEVQLSEKQQKIEQLTSMMDLTTKINIAKLQSATELKKAELQAATQLEIAQINAASKPVPAAGGEGGLPGSEGESAPAPEQPEGPSDSEVLRGLLDKFSALETAVKLIPPSAPSGDTPFALGGVATPAQASPSAERKPSRFKINRDANGKMSEVIPVFEETNA